MLYSFPCHSHKIVSNLQNDNKQSNAKLLGLKPSLSQYEFPPLFFNNDSLNTLLVTLPSLLIIILGL